MASSIYPDYPPEISDARRQFLLTNLKDWSIANGLAVRPAPSYVPTQQDPESSLATTAPVTLFPSLFPRSCFEHGIKIQTTYNKLYSAIAQDQEWLKPIVEEYVHSPSRCDSYRSLSTKFLSCCLIAIYLLMWNGQRKDWPVLATSIKTRSSMRQVH